jgi:hypothetical protein
LLAPRKGGSYGARDRAGADGSAALRSVEKVRRAVKAPRIVISATLILLAAGCANKKGDIDLEGQGINAVRSACPIVGVPAETGDVTSFNPATSTDASAIDVVADMTHVRGACNDLGEQNIVTTVTFDVQARRSDTSGPRDVTLPYFITIVRGGNAVVAKRIGNVAVHFDAGQARAQTSGQATATIARAAATLPQNVRDRLLRKRKAGNEDAAIDPLAQPDVKAAVAKATFEALVGFQLTEAQLKYNATR